MATLVVDASERLALEGKRWIYWLDKCHPETPGTPCRCYRVSIVVEHEAGHWPTGGGASDPLKEPWYWDEKTCDDANAERGFNKMDCLTILSSSMAAGKVG